MTDMSMGLDRTATCPHCGTQVPVTEANRAGLTCPNCGGDVPVLAPDYATAGHPTVDELVRAYEAQGFSSEVDVISDSQVRCGSCGAVVGGRDLEVHTMNRTEAGDDIDDTTAAGDCMLVAAVRCPRCGAPGVVVASEEDNRPLVDALNPRT